MQGKGTNYILQDSTCIQRWQARNNFPRTEANWAEISLQAAR